MTEREVWSCREILEPETGEAYAQWYFKGRRCARVPIDGPIARQVAGYQLIEKDLRSVQTWLTALGPLAQPPEATFGAFRLADRDRTDTAKGLFVACLTFYGKCFTRCEGRRVQLNRDQLSEAFRETHDGVMDYRHQFAAHSGADRFEEVFVGLAVPPQKKHFAESMLIVELKQPASALIHGRNGETTFLELTQHVHQVVAAKLDESKQALMRREVIPRGQDYWLTRAKEHR